MTFAADDFGFQIVVGKAPEGQYFKLWRNHKNSAVEGVDRPQNNFILIVRIHRIIPELNLSGLRKDLSAMNEFMPQGEKMQANRLIINYSR
jgi:hypothetical protein